MNINTEQDYFGTWHAFDSETYDGDPHTLMGVGVTKEEAINDFRNKLSEQGE